MRQQNATLRTPKYSSHRMTEPVPRKVTGTQCLACRRPTGGIFHSSVRSGQNISGCPICAAFHWPVWQCSCHPSSQLGLEWDFAGGVALSMGQSVPGLLLALMYGGSAIRLEIVIRPGNTSSRWEGMGRSGNEFLMIQRNNK